MLGALVSALLLVAIHAGAGYLAPLALLPLLYTLVHRVRGGARSSSFALGWVTGILQWGGMCYWIQGTLSRHGGMDPWLA